MNLVLVGPAYPLRGGIAHYNSSLFRELSRRHSVSAISFKRLYPGLLFPGTSQFDGGPDSFEIGAQPLIEPTNPWSWGRAAQAIREAAPQAVIFQWWHSWFAPAYRRLASEDQPARILCCHNVFPHERPAAVLRPFERRLVISTLRRFSGALVHSEQEAERLRSLVPELKVERVSHPAYDFYSRWASKPTPRQGPLRILYFGTVRRYKGLDVFLRALPAICDAIDVRVTIAGEFYVDQAQMERIAVEAGVADRVEWHDRYIPNPEVARLFENADLVVAPYVRATQSGVIAVAYEFGVPVVASDIAGLAEAVQPGRTGLLARAGDSRALAEAVIEFERQADPERYREGIATLRSELGWDRVADGILSLIPDKAHG